jgi:TP901 family phage tail tape measure protein
MALSGHEMILILRARDEASRVLRNIEGNIGNLSRAQQAAARRTISQGTALATVGVGIAAAGVAGLEFFGNAISTANEYNRQVAMTKTQVDNVKVSMKQLSDIGLEVAKTIPVPFEEIQPMLYDIFSSMDVNTTQATVLLKSFARAAVGGQVPLQEAGRATIAILNAYRLPAQRVNEVNDFMFQLVRKGVGTYHEFSTTIGRSIPSAVRAGQTYQSLGGMLAFLTRNGLSTAMATASAGRALDAISHPHTVEKLANFGKVIKTALGQHEAAKLFGKDFEKLSINIKDAHGNFLPMTDIMQKLSGVLGKLPPPQRAAILYELFKGSGGTIQARRFFDIAIPGIRDFTKLTKDMYSARGAAAAAYETMLHTPAMQAQLLKDKFTALRVEIGTYLQPVFSKLVEIGNNMLDFWNRLSPTVRRNIVLVAAASAVFLTIIGVVIAVAGAFLMLQGAAMLAGTTIGAVVGPAILIVAAILAIGAAIVYAYTHSETFRKFVNALGQALLAAGRAMITGVQTAFNWVVNTALPWLKGAWAAFVAWISNAWSNMVGWWNTASAAVARIAHAVWDPVISWLRGLLKGFQDWYKLHAEQLHRIWEYVTNAWKFLTEQFGKWVMPYIMAVWNFLSSYTRQAWNVIWTIIRGTWVILKNLLQAGFVWLKVAWNILWATVGATVRVAWSLIYNILAIAWHVISGAFSVFLDLITGHWRTAWEDIKRMVGSIWVNIKSMFGTWSREALGLLKTVGSNLLEGLKNGSLAAMKNIGSWLWNNIAKPIIDKVKDFFGISSPSKVFAEMGGHLISGFIMGLTRTNPGDLIQKVFGGMPDALGAIVNKGLVALQRLPMKAWDALQSVKGFMMAVPNATVHGKGVSKWSTVVLEALQMLGLPGTWLNVVLNRMQRESGGNPTIVNTWDSNARAGTPSMGLMQVIGPTFNAYAGRLRGRGILDPLANVYAGLNYAIHRYGSLAALNRPGGYALGTSWAQRGLALVGERGPELVAMSGGERVYNNSQSRGMLAPVKNVNVTQTIYTNEIDPRAHGAALAWEVATQVA